MVGYVAVFLRSALRFLQSLNGIPCFLVYNGGDCAFKNVLFLQCGLAGTFCLVILTDGLSQNLMPHILPAL